MQRPGSRAPHAGPDAGHARSRGRVSRVLGAVTPVGTDVAGRAGTPRGVGESVPVAAHRSDAGLRNTASARALVALGTGRSSGRGDTRGRDAASVEHRRPAGP